MWALVSALTGAGLQHVVGTRERIDEQEYVLLSSLAPTIVCVFDPLELTLRVTAEPELFKRVTLALGDARPADLVFRQSPSAFVNYGVTWQTTARPDVFLETALSLHGASLVSTFVSLGGTPPVRGLTTLTVDRRGSMQRWTLGDVATPAGDGDVSGLLTGLSIGREFAIDPYFRRYPSPVLTGIARTPSTVDVYVDDRLVQSSTLPPGPFDITRLPFTSGLGTTRVVVRDLFGGEQTYGRMYYLPAGLLDPGMRDYRFVAGARRSTDLSQPARYGPWAAFAADRRGFVRSVTAGYRLGVEQNGAAGGPTIGARLWRFGEVEGGFSISQHRRQRGGSAYAAYTFLTRGFSLSMSARAISADYAAVTAVPQGRTTTQFAGAISVPTGSQMSVSAQYVVATAADPANSGGRKDQRAALTTGLRPLGRLEFVSTASVARVSGRWQVSAAIGATVLIGSRSVVNVTHERVGARNSTVMEAQQSPPVGNGAGYRLRWSRGDEDTTHGELTYRGAFGEYQVRRDAIDAVSGTAFSASGGLVLIAGRLFPTRAVVSSYALVQVPGAAGVRVYSDNQEVGRTGRLGNALVPNLLPYHANRIGIVEADLPLDFDITATSENMAPPLRGGAVVRFAGRRIQTVVGRVVLMRAEEAIVPAFGALTVGTGDTALASPIGQTGEFYFENLAAGSYDAVVEFEAIVCRFSLIVPQSSAPLISLGTVRCVVLNPMEAVQ